MSDEIKHYGTPRHSGRYPYGSGKNPYQSSREFKTYVEDFRKKGYSDNDISKMLNMSSTEFRKKLSISNMDIYKENRARALQLKEKGYSNVKIAELMSVNGKNINESTVRNWLKTTTSDRHEETRNIAENIKKAVEDNKYIDIGSGVNLNLGITENKLKTAVAILEEEGYKRHKIYIDQMGTNHKTTMEVLTKDNVDYKELLENKYSIRVLGDRRIIDVDGQPKLMMEPIKSLDSKRLLIKYDEDGGSEMDGVIELRRGVKDISLGNAKYAQVRIAVDDKYYLKGMAVYSDDLPKGYDIRFNTNKSKTKSMHEVLKPMKVDSNGKIDKDNPFGATIQSSDSLTLIQKYYIDDDGKKKVSLLNVVNEEGDWNKWQKRLSAQFLSKQHEQLAKRQLNQQIMVQQQKYKDIMSLTNNTVKKKLLEDFADECDANAVDLKAASLPRQSNKVILPFPKMKENEVYAPTYKDGERVVLIRYPHGGTFEIPELIVRNKGSVAAKTIRNATDAIGINHKVAEKLSGADFDGDTVLVIPVNNKVKVRSDPALDGLKDFNPKKQYPYHEGMKLMTKKGTQTEMGKISNLITDMTLMGAKEQEIVRAVKHSMVVIDAEKHKLDYIQSFKDNDIASLKAKYQGGVNAGASTLISRASSKKIVPERKMYYLSPNTINPKTGEKIYTETGATKWKKKVYSNGRVEYISTPKMEDSTRMAEVNDAYTLTSGGSKRNPGTRMEGLYANYANTLKSLANQARKAYISTPNLEYNPSAAKTYSKQVSRLNSALNIALKNAPIERQAQLLANKIVEAKIKDNPSLIEDYEAIKKIKGQSISVARKRIGAKKTNIEITPDEWEAIQAGAISDSKLKKILLNSDSEKLKQYALPKQNKIMTESKISLVKTLNDSGYTIAEIADRLGVSTSSISLALKE